MVTKKNKDYLKILFLSLLSFSVLVSVYYLNADENTENEDESSYLKSEICYYALNGIIADHHYHLQLNITVINERIEIPINIGFERDSEGNTIFLHPIHTYDNSGRIHVETTKNTTAELGFFFDIWGKDFSKSKILNYTSNEDYSVKMYLNGNRVETYEKTVLEPYSFIEIEYTKND
ncbi:MAG: hypothetical protein BEU01_01280 [Marine Group III euryarchaeote CG-Epi4]|uniref:Uncharacterized protein n=1 Tax=Marine Group III euryarchaeote CG-Epi4 TaxID=1888998 RepID=A0A1J5TVW0_9ARCH|nr:MAG: hypothetical protein BEU01_01280 [Marine Group III euryarchaeote CG-Epi4]